MSLLGSVPPRGTGLGGALGSQTGQYCTAIGSNAVAQGTQVQAAKKEAIEPGIPRMAQFDFSLQWLNDVFKGYGFMPVMATGSGNTALVSLINPACKGNATLTVEHIDFTEIAKVPADTYAVTVTLPIQWFASMLVANGWPEITALNLCKSSSGVSLSALTGCDTGQPVGKEGALIALPIVRQEWLDKKAHDDRIDALNMSVAQQQAMSQAQATQAQYSAAQSQGLSASFGLSQQELANQLGSISAQPMGTPDPFNRTKDKSERTLMARFDALLKNPSAIFKVDGA